MDTPPPGKPPAKKDVLLTLLEEREARVHLDARHPGVELPAWLRNDGHVRLDYGYHFTPPIPDLVVDDTGIRATLSFRQRLEPTFIPWKAIYVIADFDGRGAVWPEDIPADMLEEFAEPKERAPEKPEPPPKKPRPSHLKLVK